jgi:hypothetical protein
LELLFARFRKNSADVSLEILQPAMVMTPEEVFEVPPTVKFDNMYTLAGNFAFPLASSNLSVGAFKPMPRRLLLVKRSNVPKLLILMLLPARKVPVKFKTLLMVASPKMFTLLNSPTLLLNVEFDDTTIPAKNVELLYEENGAYIAVGP